MIGSKTFAACLITVAGLATAPAHASLISIGLQQAGVNSGAITTVATDGGSGVVTFNGGYGTTFNTISISATGEPINSDYLLQSSVQAIATAGHTTPATLTVFITEQGLSIPYTLNDLTSSSTVNSFIGGLTAVRLETRISSTDQLYAGTIVDDTTFTGLGAFSSVDYSWPINTTFSETEVYVISGAASASRSASTNDTINFSIVPEPATMALLGASFLGLGALRRRRG